MLDSRPMPAVMYGVTTLAHRPMCTHIGPLWGPRHAVRSSQYRTLFHRDFKSGWMPEHPESGIVAYCTHVQC